MLSGYSPEYSINVLNFQIYFRLRYQTSPWAAKNYTTVYLTPQWKVYKSNTHYNDYFDFAGNPYVLDIVADGVSNSYLTLSFNIEGYYTSSLTDWSNINCPQIKLTIYHNEDGTKTLPISFKWNIGSVDNGNNIYQAIWVYDYTGTSPSTATIPYGHEGNFELELEPFPKDAKLLTATSFDDETNPTITYDNAAGESVNSLQAAISLDGTTANIAYRDIPKTATSYTFELTDTERNTLRAAATNTNSMTVYFLLKTVVGSTEYINKLEANFTIVNCDPVIRNIVVEDVNSTTSALTGSKDILIRYESMASFSYEAVAQKQASIVSHFVQNGERKVNNLFNGVIDDPESGNFIFSATDSRGISTEVLVEKSIVNYVKPTCHQDVKAEMSGETGAVVKLKVSGNYYNGSFGAAANTLKLEVRHTQNDGTMGDWVDLTDGLIPVFNGDTYELDITISGFDYSQSYEFQCRATDKLNTVISANYVVRVLPVFDWDNDDFNFNVPVGMNGQTVLRHNKEANNVVLSASGGHIYLRPGGTSDTYGEVRITPQGNIQLDGDIIINGVSLTTILSNAGLM